MNKKNKKEFVDNVLNKNEYLEKKEALTSFFSDIGYSPMTFKQIIGIFGINKNKKNILEKIIEELENEGLIIQDESKRYVVCLNNDIIKCKYLSKTSKFGFGLTENADDIYIPFELSMGAFSGDVVLVQIIKKEGNGKRREGKVIKILKNNTKKIVGEFVKNNNFGFVIPVDNKLPDIYIPKKYLSNIKNGQIVEVEIIKYATTKTKPEGRIINIIGDKNAPKIEVVALYKSHGLDELENFNKLVLEEVDKISDTVSELDEKNRVDMTNEPVVTIDSEDAMDLDDGVLVRKLNDGTYLLSVFIADVSHYVKDGSNLDKEAVKRGTSIYIPGTVTPMLPKKLSNGICSLNAGVKRLVLAVDMIIDKSGNILESNIYKAVIKVAKKMTYEKVYKVLTSKDEEVLAEYRDHLDHIYLMQELAKILKSKRKNEGSIDFDIPDTKVVLDKAGDVVGIKPYEITIANNIIEEFMLATNMVVAEKFYHLELPFIYRIHEKPDEEKLRALNEILTNYKKRIKALKNIHPKTLADIIDEIEDEEEKQVISTAMLRTLKLAKYSDECIGHFGLAARYYCHFTSPIRRYPDLFIHRVISDYIINGYNLNENKISRYSKQSQIYSISSSDAEKNATMIERDFDDLYKAIYMKNFIDEEYIARISSVTSFGLFVKLENTVEGLIPFDNMLKDDYYIYDEKRNILVGKNSSKIYKIGDKLKVRLVRVDVKSKQIDFQMI